MWESSRYPDARLQPLAEIAKTQTIIPTSFEFVDIAGLVKGAAQGEGLGNKFLSHIREVDAIIQVIRCFEDEDIHHVAGTIDPIRDIETILTELVMADMESVQKSLDRRAKDAKRGDKDAKAEYDVLAKVMPHLNEGKPALTLDLSEEEWSVLKPFSADSQTNHLRRQCERGPVGRGRSESLRGKANNMPPTIMPATR